MHLAAANGHADICLFLLDKKANPNLLNLHGKPADQACRSRELAHLLKEVAAKKWKEEGNGSGLLGGMLGIGYGGRDTETPDTDPEEGGEGHHPAPQPAVGSSDPRPKLDPSDYNQVFEGEAKPRGSRELDLGGAVDGFRGYDSRVDDDWNEEDAGTEGEESHSVSDEFEEKNTRDPSVINPNVEIGPEISTFNQDDVNNLNDSFMHGTIKLEILDASDVPDVDTSGLMNWILNPFGGQSLRSFC